MYIKLSSFNGPDLQHLTSKDTVIIYTSEKLVLDFDIDDPQGPEAKKNVYDKTKKDWSFQWHIVSDSTGTNLKFKSQDEFLEFMDDHHYKMAKLDKNEVTYSFERN